MRHERKIIRLRDYDYRQNGAYAITLCVHERRCAFGAIDNGLIRLNRFGRIASERWLAIPEHHPGVKLDEFVIMPNHIHGIVLLLNRSEEDGAPITRCFGQPQREAISSIIGSYKSGMTRQINDLRDQPTKVWQSRFYEHIIRHDRDLEHQRQYIINNPSKWADDEFYVPGL